MRAQSGDSFLESSPHQSLVLLYTAPSPRGFGDVWYVLITSPDGEIRIDYNTVEAVELWYSYSARGSANLRRVA